jgi:hypothetical protein
VAGRPNLVVVAWASLVATATGCSTVLGLDAPRLKQCDEGGCSDASGISVPSTDASDEAVIIYTSDAGVRCGAPGPQAVFCGGTNSWCCETPGDAGTVSFECVRSSSACVAAAGYPIQCSTDNDCQLQWICCFYGASGLKCAAPGDPPCGTAIQACDPNNGGECLMGQRCKKALMTAGAPGDTYFGCQ